MKLSIRWKLLLSIALPVSIIYLIVLFINYQHLKDNAYRETEVYLKEVVGHNAEKFNTQFSTAAQVARSTALFLSGHPKVSKKDLYETVVTNVMQSPFIYGSCIAFEPKQYSRKKKLFAPYAWRANGDSAQLEGIKTMDIGKEAYDYQDWQWYQEPKETDKPSWTKPYFDEGAGNIIMVTYSAPFYKEDKLLGIAPLDIAADLATDIAVDLATLGKAPDKKSKFWGVATIDINLEKLQQTSRERLMEGAKFVIFDSDGIFISHPNPDYIMKENVFSVAEKLGHPEIKELIKNLFDGESGIGLAKDFPDPGMNFVVYAPIPSTQWVIAVMVPESLIMARAWREIAKFSIFMLASLAVIVFVILLISFRVTQPIRKLSLEMEEVGRSGNLEVQKQEKFPKDEIGSLAQSFHKMIQDLKDYIAKLETETKTRESVESELRIARNIQTSLIPRTFPPFPQHKEFDLLARNLPAKYVAGDFYDYFFVSDDELVLLIADVSGKGVSSALFMAVARTLIRVTAAHSKGPAEALNTVNETMVKDKAHNLFVTLILCYYNTKTGTLRYASAGHQSPFLISQDEHITEPAHPTGTVLGVFPNIKYEEDKINLKPNEKLIFYTDGVTDARDEKGKFWGEENFKSALEEGKNLAFDKLCDEIVDKVSKYQAGHFSDDVTVVVLQRKY